MKASENRVISKWLVTYESNGFTQKKQLISKYDWENILLPIKKAITIIEENNKAKETRASSLLKQSLKILFGDYNTCFVEGSPFYHSIETGFISLPQHQGGNHKVYWKITEI